MFSCHCVFTFTEQNMMRQSVGDIPPDDSLCSEPQMEDVENPMKPIVHDVLDASSVSSDKIEDPERNKSLSPTLASKKPPYENYVNIQVAESMSRLRSSSPAASG